jgi:E3 ubiquitin-protein ligase BAH
MKFGHTFQEALAADTYPPEWVAAAIRYRQLKKCIKKVQKELVSLGLCGKTLQQLVDNGERKGLISYWFQGTLKEFAPMLVLTIDPEQGIPIDLELQEDTRKALEELANGGGKIIDITDGFIDPNSSPKDESTSPKLDDSPEGSECADEEETKKR